MSTLTSMEKYRKAISLEPFSDRTEIPVFPLMITSLPALAGIKQVEVFNSIDRWLESAEITFNKIGWPDIMAVAYPRDSVFNMYLRSNIPGRELDDDAAYQFIETPYFNNPSEYKHIMEIGWDAWFAKYTMDIQTPPMKDPAELVARYEQVGQNFGKTFGFIYGHGMVPWFNNASYPIFDALSMFRSMEAFIYDLVDDPDPIMDVVNTFTPSEIKRLIEQTKAQNGWTINLFAMRSSSTFLSPDMFEEYAWPALKQSIEAFNEAGLHTILHADANWLPMLEYFTQVPKGCMHIELDGVTDIQAAYDILSGWQCIQGDVPATMLCYSSEDEVKEYCEKLIQMGMKGGFMLGSGCEVPMNAKAENVAAMIASVRQVLLAFCGWPCWPLASSIANVEQV